MAISRRKTKAGRVTGYTVTVSISNPGGGRGRRVTIGTYRLRRLAEEAERRAKDEIQSGTFASKQDQLPATLTVADVVDVWFATKRLNVEPNTATGYESAIRLHLLPALGDLPVDALTHDELQRQVNTWRNDGMGAQLLKRCVMILRGALTNAVRRGLIPFNPAEGIEKPSARSRRHRMIWTDEQIGAFLATAEDDRLAPFWFLTLLEGMRRGEALGLRWGDIHRGEDGSTAVAIISQTIVPDLTSGGRALIQSRAKTKSSQRTVLLTSPTVAVLRHHKERQQQERKSMPDLWPDHDLIVTTAIGTPITPSSVKRFRQQLIAKAGVPSVSTHGLRHMSATLMLRAGVSPALVASKLGHTDISTTVDAYGHLIASDQSAANVALEASAQRGRLARGA
jgi:integrase